MFIPFLIFRSFVQLLWACGFEGIEAGRITSYWTPFVWRPLHLQPSPPSGSNLAATCCIYDESREGNDPSRPWRDLITRYVSLDRDSWLQGGHWNVSVAVGLRWGTGSGHRMTSLWYSWSSIQGRENRSASNRNYIRSQIKYNRRYTEDHTEEVHTHITCQFAAASYPAPFWLLWANLLRRRKKAPWNPLHLAAHWFSSMWNSPFCKRVKHLINTLVWLFRVQHDLNVHPKNHNDSSTRRTYIAWFIQAELWWIHQGTVTAAIRQDLLLLTHRASHGSALSKHCSTDWKTHKPLVLTLHNLYLRW